MPVVLFSKLCSHEQNALMFYQGIYIVLKPELSIPDTGLLD
jgi:hypothetical protein